MFIVSDYYFLFCFLHTNSSFWYAGRGSVLTNKGLIEMDAIIMEGNTLKTGNKKVFSPIYSNSVGLVLNISPVLCRCCRRNK